MRFIFDTTEISVNVPDQATLLREVRDRFRAKAGFALATINLDHLVKLRSSASFRAAYAAQDLVTADGNPIVWLSRLAGKDMSLVPGSDSILPLCRVAAEEGVTLALVGSTEASLSAAADYLQSQVPGLTVVAKIAPPFGFDPNGEEAAAIFDNLNQSGAGLCLIALGAPKQELFAAAGRQKSPTIGFASIGAGLDFFAGTQTRAPEWVRKFAMEWLWRALSSPKRLGPRYLKCIAILPGQVIRAVFMRFSQG
ncbi:WecB/TagA/CpsF family glycosyltransferase [Pseudoprimorskyibacter insulae]|uniref:UDP-N-acetyl-D-mannosaminuronic acid transferase n=1 Tax=Pseudoprimorskyibacter insulae TaxID=1695997 RepID=A0A2R8AU10_9RHOB|nr:WecB/TagA/CpsF family glycosyltransferase [Pseudoprimorskyibacter insulae]SPF79470.1 UDP-N-acetyl-D-mannosaminuronic acid transferase [Pseudoprimorskyibacter insulae]